MVHRNDLLRFEDGPRRLLKLKQEQVRAPYCVVISGLMSCIQGSFLLFSERLFSSGNAFDIEVIWRCFPDCSRSGDEVSDAFQDF